MPLTPVPQASRPLPRSHTREREVLVFLLVGGVGYAVDVLAFSLLRQVPLLHAWDPSVARSLAALLAIAVNYQGNRRFTWQRSSRHGRRKEELLFGAFSLVGLLISVLCLVVSHDLLGWRSLLADNISANVVGLGLGTTFRFWSYRRFVFSPPTATVPAPGCSPA